MATRAPEGDRSSDATVPPRRGHGPRDLRSTVLGPATTQPASSSGGGFQVRGLVLLDSAGRDPVNIYALHFGDEGIGLVGREGNPPRVLPWTSVATHAVEPWGGGTIPIRWVRTGQSGRSASPGSGDSVQARRERREGAVRSRRGRPLPYVDAGALIHIRTPSGTYRFLLPKADPVALDDRISAIAVRHRGSAAASSVTRAHPTGVARPRHGAGWERWQPILVVMLVVVVAAAVTLILLQSSGAVHLPFLGGTGSGAPPARPRVLVSPIGL